MRYELWYADDGGRILTEEFDAASDRAAESSARTIIRYLQLQRKAEVAELGFTYRKRRERGDYQLLALENKTSGRWVVKCGQKTE